MRVTVGPPEASEAMCGVGESGDESLEANHEPSKGDACVADGVLFLLVEARGHGGDEQVEEEHDDLRRRYGEMRGDVRRCEEEHDDLRRAVWIRATSGRAQGKEGGMDGTSV